MQQIYNSLSRKIEPIKPINPAKIGLYSCGPTVYDFAHIGNLRTFLFEDVLRRTLKANGFEVRQVKNLTDVDDKTIRSSQQAGLSLKEFTEKYAQAFFEDIDALNMERAEVYPRATEHIAEMIKIIECLLQKGLAYKSDDGVYFAIKKFPAYGNVAHLDRAGLMAGASGRVLSDEYEKENVADFALWKFWDEADGEVKWEAPFGAGRPGWHIECSAMSTKYLGETFDIHTGGIDLLFPHHEDEVAQSMGCTGKPLANVWVHAEHLMVDGRKMSKSLGNFYTLRDIVKHGFHPIAFRYLVLGAHYRSKLNFTWEALQGAQNALYKLYDRVRELEAPAIGCADYERQFLEALNNDLNTPQALAVVWQLLDDKTLPSSGVAETLLHFDQVLGLGLSDVLGKPMEIPQTVQALLGERQRAREEKNWERSDELRDQIAALGYEVDDTAEGVKVRKSASRV